MDFIFMLTHADRTVDDCLETLEKAAGLGLRHVGFKDVGSDPRTRQALARRIRELGATSYLEVVSTDRQGCLEAARAAVDLGIDRLLGGTEVEAVLGILAGTGIDYYPFPGRPHGHPTRLGGDAALVAEHCRQARALGCAGVDLLAWRATEAEPLELVRAARAALGGGRLVVAGSIDSPAKVRALAEAGADAFTVGSAIFERAWAPGAPELADQLRAVLAAAEG